ncbi:MAG: GNAT family N-acetyltransferase [Armatimonadota bacterium]|nr:MAG: GNAT family N-acetyltransferase [Armatimonadota bacterium]
MDVEIADLSEAVLEHLPDWSSHGSARDAGCRFCLYWEEPDRAKWPEPLHEREALKREWVRRVTAEFGVCGKLAFVGSKAVGYSQFSPPAHLPNVTSYECGPPSSDAVFVACLFVVREHRGHGVGSALLRAVVAELSSRGVEAVETLARRGSADNPSGPLGFWLKHNFTVVREDDEFALVRQEFA